MLGLYLLHTPVACYVHLSPVHTEGKVMNLQANEPGQVSPHDRQVVPLAIPACQYG